MAPYDDVMASLGLEPSGPAKARPSRGPSAFARGIRKYAACGTPSGANRHYQLRQPVCEDCREAKNAAARKTCANRRKVQKAARDKRSAA